MQNRQAQTNTILSATRVIKITMALLAALLVLASVLLISNTIRLSLFSRRREVEVMKLVGATDWFIRWPFVLEGLFLGAIGGAAAIGLLALAKVTLVDPLANTVKLISQPDMIAFPLLIVDPDGLRDRRIGCRLGHLAAALPQGLTRSLRGRDAHQTTTAAAGGARGCSAGPAGPRRLPRRPPGDLPGFARSVFVADHETRVVDEAIDRIASDYYRPVAKGRLTNASIAGAVSSLGDRFSHYLSPREYRQSNQPPSFTGIGVSVGPDRRGLRIARVFDSSPAAHAGLRAGDLIVMANGAQARRPPRGKGDRADQGPAGDRREARRRAASGRTHGGRTADADARDDLRAGRRIGDQGLPRRQARRRRARHVQRRRARRSARRRRTRAARGSAGIVLDLRANGGGLVEEARLIASIFVAKGTIVSTRGRTQPSETLSATGGTISPKVPVVVLVDGNTASAAEIVTAALQDHRRATVVGTHTFGKGVFQEEEQLPTAARWTSRSGEYFTPNGATSEEAASSRAPA